MISVPLNSFVHRVPDKSIIATLAMKYSCQLKRIRRSRNWLLSGQEAQLRMLTTELREEHHLWIAKAIEKVLPTPRLSLSQVLAQTPNMTLNQLVSETGCSLLEARQAIDEFEDL